MLAERARHSETLVRIADERDAALSESDCLRAIIEAMQRHHSGRRPEPLDFDPLGFGLEGTEQALAAAKVKGESLKAPPALEPAKRLAGLKTPFAAHFAPTE